MTEEPYPEIGITEETRRMYPETYSDKIGKVMSNMIDEIVAQIHIIPVVVFVVAVRE